MNSSYSKIRHIQESNIRLERRLLTEQLTGQTVVNKVATEGLKNISQQMVVDPPFPGAWNQYTFGGIYNGVDYQWDCTGVDGMVNSNSGRGGLFVGEIVTANGKDMFMYLEERDRPTDFNPETNCVGIWNPNSQSGFAIYLTTSNKPKCSKI